MNKVLLVKHSIEILKAYAGSTEAKPERFEEVAISAYEALKALVDHTKKN